MAKTALQKLIEKLEAVRDKSITVAPERTDAYQWTIDYIKESLLPYEKEEYRKCFRSGINHGTDITANHHDPAPDFPTWFRQFETEQSSNQ